MINNSSNQCFENQLHNSPINQIPSNQIQPRLLTRYTSLLIQIFDEEKFPVIRGKLKGYTSGREAIGKVRGSLSPKIVHRS